MIEFGKHIVEATQSIATCYKINTAFYERFGRAGIDAMYAIREAIGTAYVIADCKRGDIGNTSAAYADAMFGDFGADAVTVAPYMGRDSVEPFLSVANKMVYVLALTSNPGSNDFQRQIVNGRPLYDVVMETAMQWTRSADIGFVVGATHSAELAEIRQRIGSVPLLIPGIGAQGGSAVEISIANGGLPAVFNVSRAILYPTDNRRFDLESIQRAAKLFASQLRLSAE